MTRIADLLDLHTDGARPALDRGQQRRRGLPLPAARGRPRGDLRRRPGRRGRARAPPDAPWWPSRSAASATGSTGRSPTGELTGEMIAHRGRATWSRAPVSRVIIRDPDATADDFVALAARLGLHGTDYVVGWTAWLDLAPVGVSQGLGPGARRRASSASTPPTCSRSATGATTSRCCAGPDAAWPWARRSTSVHRGRGRRDRHRGRRRSRHRAGGGTLMLLDVVETERLRLPIWTHADVARDPRR